MILIPICTVFENIYVRLKGYRIFIISAFLLPHHFLTFFLGNNLNLSAKEEALIAIDSELLLQLSN